jgi:prevent-host-death family protein
MSMSVAEAKSQFSAVVERATAGEETLITKHGKPVAKVVPVRSQVDRERAKRAFEELINIRDGASLRGLRIKDLIEEGRM